jgi:O-succinylhomoserine sulfhydrylase
MTKTSKVAKKYQELNHRRDLGFSTRGIRAGYIPDDSLSHSEPLHLTSAYHYESSDHASALYRLEEEGKVYTRLHNPTTDIFEARIASLEKTEDALATASGMSAITLVFLSFLSAGETVVCAKQVYGGTQQLLNVTLAKFGVKTVWIDGTKIDEWEKAIIEYKPKLVFFETPTNPTLSLVDIEKVVKIAKRVGSKTVIDNTLTSPASQTPADFGVDIIVHAATKYIDGQGRSLGGVICSTKEIIGRIRTIELRNTGPAISPFDSWVFLKGLETLEIRIEKHSQNALRIAEFLEKHPKVKNVNYPFLKSHPQYELAKKQQKFGGGLLSFEVDSFETGKNLVDSVKLISLVGNLGDTKTIVGHPASTSHQQLGEEKQREAGITPELVRLSVGLESVEDLIKDLDQALGGGGLQKQPIKNEQGNFKIQFV